MKRTQTLRKITRSTNLTETEKRKLIVSDGTYKGFGIYELYGCLFRLIPGGFEQIRKDGSIVSFN